MELGPQHQPKDGLLRPESIMVVYVDPEGYRIWAHGPLGQGVRVTALGLGLGKETVRV